MDDPRTTRTPAAWLYEQLVDGAARIELWDLQDPQRRVAEWAIDKAAPIESVAVDIGARSREPGERLGHALFAYGRGTEEAIGLALVLRNGVVVRADLSARSAESLEFVRLLRECEARARAARFER